MDVVRVFRSILEINRYSFPNRINQADFVMTVFTVR